MSNATFARLRMCGVALASVGALSLLAAGGANAATCTANTTTKLEECVKTANANAEANTIVVEGVPNTHEAGPYLPGPAPLKLENTHGLQTIEGPTSTPEATIDGANIEVEHPELFVVDAGVSAKFKNIVIAHAGASGGAAGIEDFGSLEIEGSTISGRGNAVTVQSTGSLTVLNSTVSDGLSDGILNEGTATFKNATIAFNELGGLENAGALHLANTIIAENGPAGTKQCTGTAAATNTHSLSSDESCHVEKQNMGAKLGTAFNNGGPTLLHSLKPGSPAIDTVPKAECPAKDQRGLARPDPTPLEEFCDIGADEYNETLPTITVPGEIKVPATATTGAVVTYAASATGHENNIRTFSCTPASGSTFPIGRTTVTCTAVDGHENKATATFVVNVTAPLNWFSNNVKGTASKVGITAWGPLKGVSTALELEVECVQTFFGANFNEGSPLTAGHGEILGWDGTGDATSAGGETRRSCKSHKTGVTGEPEAWITTEPVVETTRKSPLTVPWKYELNCAESESVAHAIVTIGLPPGAAAPSAECKTEAEKATEIEKEETERKNCFATTVPEGCIKMNVALPTLALEEVFEGTQQPKITNGFTNGLHASTWEWTGSPLGKLHLKGAFTTTMALSGTAKAIGFGSIQLITAK
jgi:hypothetical protein